MYSIDMFVETLAKAMEIAKDIPGIENIHWEIHSYGRTEAVKELVQKMDIMMKEVNGNGESKVEEVA